MKKMFLAALTAMALCSYGYAQDDEDEYEEDEAPARVEKKAAVEDDEDEDEAPAKKSSKKEKKAPSKPVDAGAGFMALGLDLVDALDGDGLQKFYLTFKLAPNMELSAIIGFYHHGETTTEVNGVEAKGEDDYTQLQIGAGFDYFVAQKVLPISIGGELLYSSWGEDNSQIDINVLPGFRANLVGGLTLTGKVGLGINYKMWSEGLADSDRLDFGLKTAAQLHWFFL